jgi:hypothetical protein
MIVVDLIEVEAGALEAVVASGSDRCRLVVPQPAASTVPTPIDAAAEARLIERMGAVSGRRSEAAMGRAPLPWRFHHS